jgi:hypothetical protein
MLSAARKAGIITGLPDACGRGRIIVSAGGAVRKAAGKPACSPPVHHPVETFAHSTRSKK